MSEASPETSPQPNAIAVDDVTDDVIVTTKPFALTPKAYFKIMLRINFGKIWWHLPFIATVILGLELARWRFLGYFGTEPYPGLAFFILVMEIGLFAYLALYYGKVYWHLRATAYHQSNKAIMHPRVMTLSRKKLVVQAVDENPEEDSVWVYKNEDVFQTVTTKWCYLFFLTPIMFVYVLKDAFQNDADREFFETTILPTYPQQKSSLKRGILYYFLSVAVTIAAGVVAAIITLFILQ